MVLSTLPLHDMYRSLPIARKLGKCNKANDTKAYFVTIDFHNIYDALHLLVSRNPHVSPIT